MQQHPSLRVILWFVSGMRKNNTFTRQNFTRIHFFTPHVIIFNAKHFLTENIVTVTGS